MNFQIPHVTNQYQCAGSMEDAIFNKKAIPDVYNMKDAKQEKIEAGRVPLYSAQFHSQLVLQSAIEDLDNATSTVKGWKASWGLGRFWI